MTKTDLLLTNLLEGLSRAQLPIAKALQFGLDDGYPNRATRNREDITQAFYEAFAVFKVLLDDGTLPGLTDDQYVEVVLERKSFIKHMLRTRELNDDKN